MELARHTFEESGSGLSLSPEPAESIVHIYYIIYFRVLKRHILPGAHARRHFALVIK